MKPYDRIERLIAEWEPQLRDSFLKVVRQLRDRVRLGDLVALLKARDIDGVIRLIGLNPASFLDLDRAFEAAYVAGGIDAAQGIGVRIAQFDYRGSGAAAWVQAHTTGLISQITDDQRAMIRIVLAPLSSGADPMLTGNTPQKLALDLVGRINRVTGQREGGVLGLTAEQAKWAVNYEAELRGIPDAAALTRTLRDRRFDAIVRRAIKERKALSADTRQAMVNAYRNRALLYRANVIALNESSVAMQESQTQAWEQAIRRGAVDPASVRRFWITAGDDKVRPTHAAVPFMNTKGVGLHEAFMTPKGPTLQPGWAFDPGCRCRVRVRVVAQAQPAPAQTPAPALASAA